MKSNIFQIRIFTGVFLVVFGMMSLTGCMSLRKKFTRVKKNKDAKEAFIPVLQPIEYKKVEETPAQVYAQHYSMVKIYFKDLWDTLGKKDSSAKREKYMFTEILAHVDAMTGLLIESKLKEAGILRDRIKNLLLEYEKPDGLRRYDVLTGALRSIERDIYHALKPAVVDGFLVSVAP